MHYLFSESISEDMIILEGDEARHAAVLRLKPGEEIGVLNGQGRIAYGTAEEGRKIFRVLISRIEQKSLPAFKLHIAIAPTKQMDRTEWFLEKATELGVYEITLLNCDHGERQRVNQERLQKILIAAIKQSGRPWLPKLNQPISLEALFKSTIAESIYVAHAGGLSVTEWDLAGKLPASLCFCVGPEGDFSDKELALIKKLSIPAVSFGGYRLRTETAGVYAAAYFAQRN